MLLGLASSMARRCVSSGGSGTAASLSHRELSSEHAVSVKFCFGLFGLDLGLAGLAALAC